MSDTTPVRDKSNAELMATVRESLAPGLPGAEEALAEIERRLAHPLPKRVRLEPVVRARGGL